jgi:hypothetical protein
VRCAVGWQPRAAPLRAAPRPAHCGGWACRSAARQSRPSWVSACQGSAVCSRQRRAQPPISRRRPPVVTRPPLPVYEEINANVLVLGDYKAFNKDNPSIPVNVDVLVRSGGWAGGCGVAAGLRPASVCFQRPSFMHRPVHAMARRDRFSRTCKPAACRTARPHPPGPAGERPLPPGPPRVQGPVQGAVWLHEQVRGGVQGLLHHRGCAQSG